MQGIIVLNKPEGFTSMDCCAIIRKLTGTKKVGHTGTLDPNATGVLPICIGKATRLIEYMDDSPKVYRAGLKLGFTSDTEDIWGNVTERDSKLALCISRDDFEAALSKFSGDMFQTPPMYSAKKINGQKLYDLARTGKTVERKANKIHIYSSEIISFGNGLAEIEIKCSRGTYIRTICSDLGEMLGCGAVMTSLIRLSASSYNIDEAVDLELLRSHPELIGDYLSDIESAVRFMKKRVINDSEYRLLINGNPEFIINDDELNAVFYHDKLIGITKDKRIQKVFNENI